MPRLAENLVCVHLGQTWFWKKYTEVDFFDKKVPVEVKYTESKPDVKNVLLAVRALKAKRVLVVTKDIEGVERKNGIEIEYIPLWKFLLKPPGTPPG